jgi:predicted kinase
MKFKIDDRVIVKDSGDGEYRIGTFLGYDTEITNCKDDIPVVMFDGDTEPMMCFGMTIPFSDEMVERLSKFSPEDQYTLLWTIHDWENGKELILMRGLPGSGKSTRARELAGHFGQVFSTDDFFVDVDGNYKWFGNLLGKAHDWNQRRSLAALHANIPIVVIDNTNTTLKDLRSYLPHINAARQLGYTVRVEEPQTSWKFDLDELVELNTHNVPRVAIETMLNRYVKDVKVEDIILLFSHPSTH